LADLINLEDTSGPLLEERTFGHTFFGYEAAKQNKLSRKAVVDAAIIFGWRKERKVNGLRESEGWILLLLSVTQPGQAISP